MILRERSDVALTLALAELMTTVVQEKKRLETNRRYFSFFLLVHKRRNKQQLNNLQTDTQTKDIYPLGAFGVGASPCLQIVLVIPVAGSTRMTLVTAEFRVKAGYSQPPHARSWLKSLLGALLAGVQT